MLIGFFTPTKLFMAHMKIKTISSACHQGNRMNDDVVDA
nr:B263 [uncultured bacterium]ART41101.1 L507 [uncultured bacterium]